MPGDKQNEQLAEWLQLIGCPVHLAPTDLQLFNKPNMRAVWRHLQNHVMPVQSIQTVKRNLLLQKLKNQEILPGRFGNFKIETVQELSQLQNLSETQEEIKMVKVKLKTIDGMLQSNTCVLLAKLSEKECFIEQLNETESKTTLLNLKLSHLKKDFDKLDEKLDIAQALVIPRTPNSISELKHNKTIVAKCVSNHKLVPCQAVCNDVYLNGVVQIILEYPAITVFDGILLASYHALRSLRQIKLNLDLPDGVSSWREKLVENGSSSFSKDLRDLKSLLIQNELDVVKCLKKVNELSAELEKEKLILSNSIGEVMLKNSSYSENDSKDIPNESFEEYIDKLARDMITFRKAKEIKGLKDKLEEECTDFNNFKCLIANLGEKESVLFEEVSKKISDINNLTSQICNSNVNTTKAEVLQTCTEKTSTLLDKLKLTGVVNAELVLESESSSRREIETFQKSPLVALFRKWEEEHHLIPKDTVKDILKNPSLLCLLVQSEPKDILKGVLEKLCWSQTVDSLWTL